ncbi:uncharacterized protein V6R79_003951 [Siganus canaliculatus]
MTQEEKPAKGEWIRVKQGATDTYVCSDKKCLMAADSHSVTGWMASSPGHQDETGCEPQGCRCAFVGPAVTDKPGPFSYNIQRRQETKRRLFALFPPRCAQPFFGSVFDSSSSRSNPVRLLRASTLIST